MLKIAKHTRYCPAIQREVIVDCQHVEVSKGASGPETVVSCNSKHICKLVYEDDVLMIKLNWQRCVLNA